jgi:hypothetical protein
VTRSLTVVLAIVGDLIAVLFRCRDRRESIPPAATGSLPGAQNPAAPPKSRHEIGLGGPESILPLGERSGDCETGHLCPVLST